jgi:hypothetical protein
MGACRSKSWAEKAVADSVGVTTADADKKVRLAVPVKLADGAAVDRVMNAFAKRKDDEDLMVVLAVASSAAETENFILAPSLMLFPLGLFAQRKRHEVCCS